MGLIIKEVNARSILSKSGIPGADYCINPYTGCFHSCKYCYASFMKRFTGHTEPWGSFVDIKINAPEVLRKELKRTSNKGSIIISSVTDPYQPVEGKYKITRKCFEELVPYSFSIDILTKSPLVTRDVDIFRKFKGLEVGLTITTDDDKVRKIFEPKAPPIETRVNALKKLHAQGIRTYAFIGPVLPMNADVLTEKLIKHVDFVYIDSMNYTSKTVNIYHRLGLQKWLEKEFLDEALMKLKKGFRGKNTTFC